MPIDYLSARALLDEALQDVLSDFLGSNGITPLPDDLVLQCRRVFQSATQAYREALLGCVIARLQDPTINPRKPYMNQGEGAYNGRTMDERVINPFLQDHRIPCSKGPYLSVFRRSVLFEESTRAGVRDKEGFDAMLCCIAYIEATTDPRQQRAFLRHLLYRFVEMREASSVPLSRLQRFSLSQYGSLVAKLLAVPSGGRFPVFLVVAAFRAISDRFQLGWNVEVQGINVADRPSGAGGDITISLGSVLLMAAEITERPVGRDRVVSIFNTKIAPASIVDYLFFVNQEPDERVRQQCQQYFAQGHELNFVHIATWLNMMLATIGKGGRESFNQQLLSMLDDPSTPQSVRASWNEVVACVIEAR
jgi:hypothetical protein